MSEWISVRDRLPEKSMKVLAYAPNPYIPEARGTIMVLDYSHRWKAFNAFDSTDAEYAIKDVTHWMTLPEAPEEEE